MPRCPSVACTALSLSSLPTKTQFLSKSHIPGFEGLSHTVFPEYSCSFKLSTTCGCQSPYFGLASGSFSALMKFHLYHSRQRAMHECPCPRVFRTLLAFGTSTSISATHDPPPNTTPGPSVPAPIAQQSHITLDTFPPEAIGHIAKALSSRDTNRMAQVNHRSHRGVGHLLRQSVELKAAGSAQGWLALDTPKLRGKHRDSTRLQDLTYLCLGDQKYNQQVAS